MIDIRCGASLDCPSHEEGRCQLLMGHEGAHAVMFSRGGHLEIRMWRRLGAPDAADHIAGCEMRPWALGYPRPAWSEDASLVDASPVGRDVPNRRSPTSPG